MNPENSEFSHSWGPEADIRQPTNIAFLLSAPQFGCLFLLSVISHFIVFRTH